MRGMGHLLFTLPQTRNKEGGILHFASHMQNAMAMFNDPRFSDITLIAEPSSETPIWWPEEEPTLATPRRVSQSRQLRQSTPSPSSLSTSAAAAAAAEEDEFGDEELGEEASALALLPNGAGPFGAGPSGRQFHCHRAILAASSPFFEKMFDSGMREAGEKEVMIRDAGVMALGWILYYCYTGACQLDQRNAPEVLVLADRFGMMELRDACSTFVEQAVAVETCGPYLELAQRYGNLDLAAVCLDFILDNFEAFSVSRFLPHVSHANLALLLGHDDLQVDSELVAFDAAVEWVKHDPARHELAGSLFDLIRFPTMTLAHLSHIGSSGPLMTRFPQLQARLLNAFVYLGLPYIEQQAKADAHQGPNIYHPRNFEQPVAFDYTGLLQHWTVYRSGYYRISCKGAKAADGKAKAGGRGAHITAVVALKEGDVLMVLCGGMSQRSPAGDSGGGGASFVAFADKPATPIVVAGGGGGTRGDPTDHNGCDANHLGEIGTAGTGSFSAAGGRSGEGGRGARSNYGGAGGGWASAGSEGSKTDRNGRSLRASSDASLHCTKCGGFGGGGGVGERGGGGGGGYSGGGAGQGGGGGGSYVTPSALQVTRKVGHGGHGFVSIARVSSAKIIAEQQGSEE